MELTPLRGSALSPMLEKRPRLQRNADKMQQKCEKDETSPKLFVWSVKSASE